jgi:hypothetical protein
MMVALVFADLCLILLTFAYCLNLPTFAYATRQHKLPPLFSKGVIFSNQKLFLTVSVKTPTVCGIVEKVPLCLSAHRTSHRLRLFRGIRLARGGAKLLTGNRVLARARCVC